MNRSDLTTTATLNDVSGVIRRVASPAAGILLLCELPYRLLQVHIIDVLVRLGGDAQHYGNFLKALVTLNVFAFLIAVYGRAVFMRACRNNSQTWRDLLNVGFKRWLTFAYVSLLAQLVLVMSAFTVIAIPLLTVIAGAAAIASADAPRVGPLAALRAVGPYLHNGRVLAGLTFVFTIGFAVTAVNLVFLSRLVVWLASTIPAFDDVRWTTVVSGGSTRFVLAICAAAWLIIQPFWLAAMHVYGQRVRSRHTGDDIRRRFIDLTGVRAAALIAIVALLIAALAGADPLTVNTYAARWVGLRTSLQNRDWKSAAMLAKELADTSSIAHNGVAFEPDRALLDDISAAAQTGAADLTLIRRIDATITALAAIEMPSAVTPDPSLLKRVRDRELVPELPRGGEVLDVEASNAPVFAEIRRLFALTIDWLAARLEKFVDWILSLRKTDKEDATTFFGFPVVVWLVTLLIVAAVATLAVYVLRRSRPRAQPEVTSTPVARSARDADPLSREAREWEQYAQELAASGRVREAIRAWYHAVLMTLYRSGILHYRKGRTNWEYVSAIGPQHEWRPRFVALTRLFDREWYGHHDAEADVLDACTSDAQMILETIRERVR